MWRRVVCFSDVAVEIYAWIFTLKMEDSKEGVQISKKKKEEKKTTPKDGANY